MRVVTLLALVACACAVATASAASSLLDKDADNGLTALQEYVNRPDAHYKWTYMPENNLVGDGFTAYMVNLTSQKWLDETMVNMPIWFHTLYVIVPNNLNPNFSSNAVNWLANHYNNPSDPSKNLFKLDEENMIMAAVMAVSMQTVVTVTFHIPNQALVFADDPQHISRHEDANIAWTWNHFLRHPNDTEWLLRLPMTKGAVRAMDATEEFMSQHFQQDISKWIVSGPSKRGWTSYTTAACAPDRVIGFAPIVLDAADFMAVAEHQYRSYGGWSFALSDYLASNITVQLANPNFQTLLDIVAPISYADILSKIPKFIISASGDEFGLPDDILLYWDKFRGEKHFRLMPNIDHTMAGDPFGVLETVASWGLLLQAQVERPTYSWSIGPDGAITLECDRAWAPTTVKLWQADSIDGNERRDFRLVVWNKTANTEAFHPVWFTSTVESPISTNATTVTYSALVDPPAEGWVCFYMEINWASIGGSTFKSSTGASILPQTYPSEMCQGDECAGPIV